MASDTDNAVDVYENGTGGLRHVTDDPSGPDADLYADLAGITPDGSRAYFATSESMAATDTDAVQDIYERTSGGFRHVSDDPTGPDGELAAEFRGASADGPGSQRDATPPRLSRVKHARRRLRFTLSEPADVRIVIRKGRRARTLRFADRAAGANRVRLRVRAGRYRVTITATDAAGNRSQARRIRFRAR